MALMDDPLYALPTTIVLSSVYDDSDSDSDIDLTPPTIIKRKAEAPKRMKSKFKGVFRCGKKYKAQIQTAGVQHYLGLFDVEEDAARAYDTHARATFGPKAKTNFDYDPNEPIPHPDSALAQPKSHATVPLPFFSTIAGPPKEFPKGSHPRRTYVGIKARRKRLGQFQDTFPANNRPMSPEKEKPEKVSVAGGTSSGEPKSRSVTKRMDIPQDPTWRDRIQYLVGGMCFKSSNKSSSSASGFSLSNVSLKGKWMHVWNLTPPKEQVSNWSNNNEFYFESLMEENMPPLSFSNNSSLPVPRRYTGFHVEIQGAVMTKCEEEPIELIFSPDSTRSNSYNVFGKGKSDLGLFVMTGVYNSESQEIEMLRRFVLDSDPITSFSLEQMRDNLYQVNPVGQESSSVPLA